MLNAGYAGAMAVLIQTTAMGAYFSKPDELKLTFIHWQQSLGAGFWGALATLCWLLRSRLCRGACTRRGAVELLMPWEFRCFISGKDDADGSRVDPVADGLDHHGSARMMAGLNPFG